MEAVRATKITYPAAMLGFTQIKTNIDNLTILLSAYDYFLDRHKHVTFSKKSAEAKEELAKIRKQVIESEIYVKLQTVQNLKLAPDALYLYLHGFPEFLTHQVFTKENTVRKFSMTAHTLASRLKKNEELAFSNADLVFLDSCYGSYHTEELVNRIHKTVDAPQGVSIHLLNPHKKEDYLQELKQQAIFTPEFYELSNSINSMPFVRDYSETITSQVNSLNSCPESWKTKTFKEALMNYLFKEDLSKLQNFDGVFGEIIRYTPSGQKEIVSDEYPNVLSESTRNKNLPKVPINARCNRPPRIDLNTMPEVPTVATPQPRLTPPPTRDAQTVTRLSLSR